MALKDRILDSSCWIEIFTEGKKSKECEKFLKESKNIFVPSLIIFEVYKKILSITSEDRALSAVSFMSQNQVIDLTRETVLLAADLSIEFNLAMADSIVYAHACNLDAELVTREYDFHKLPKVIFVK